MTKTEILEAIVKKQDELLKVKDKFTDLVIKAWKLIYAGKPVPFDHYEGNPELIDKLELKLDDLKQQLAECSDIESEDDGYNDSLCRCKNPIIMEGVCEKICKKCWGFIY